MFLIDVAEMSSNDEPTRTHTPHPLSLCWCAARARASYASADVEYMYTGDSWRMLASADWFAVETAKLHTHTHTHPPPAATSATEMSRLGGSV